MIVVTTDTLDGFSIEEYLGVVRGVDVQSATLREGISGGLKNLVGGNISSFRNTITSARELAYAELITNAEKMGANAVIGFRYDTTGNVSNGSATEVVCYGTAVIIRKS